MINTLNFLLLLIALNPVVFTSAIFAPGTVASCPGDTLYYLNIPARPADAVTGSALVEKVTGMSIEDRERELVEEILSGNVPSFSRKLESLRISQTVDEKDYELVYFVSCDYMAVGSDQEYLYVPLTPSTAQYLADSLDCILPTKKIVDNIYNESDIKLSPQPIPPSDKMTTIAVFAQHTDSIKEQISILGLDRSLNKIIAGHKKDIILSNEIYNSERNSGRVVIYGWHKSENNPIQPVYSGHIARYADYSHGLRLVSNKALLNGHPIHLDDILKDPVLSILVSSESVISRPYYPESKISTLQGTRF